MLLLAAKVVAQAVPAESETTYWTLLGRLLPHAMYVFAKMSISRGQHGCRLLGKDDVPASVSHELGHLLVAQTKLVEAETMYKRALAGQGESTRSRAHRHTPHSQQPWPSLPQAALSPRSFDQRI